MMPELTVEDYLSNCESPCWLDAPEAGPTPRQIMALATNTVRLTEALAPATGFKATVGWLAVVVASHAFVIGATEEDVVALVLGEFAPPSTTFWFEAFERGVTE